MRAALLLLLLQGAVAEILTPPYLNLALGKKITATATCGEEGPELYCKLVGASANDDERVIQGQVCDVCDATNELKMHPPEYAVDGLETRWQSPPLSRGMKYNEVNLTIDLGQEFHVAYVFVKMGNSPRPGLWALEKSQDYGKTFKPWQYFSDSVQDCERYFGKESLQPITRDDSVICTTEYSQIVPLEGGEIPISLLNYRPSANKYFNSSVLQDWTRATTVRLRLLRTKNLLAHLMSVARQDPTVTRRYFYSIKDISIGGRCMCNGHAENCDPAQENILVCRCQHNTCGPQCAQCCPGFEQKKWRISQNWDRFSCEPCNCHNHTTECKYDPQVDEKHLSLDIHGRYEGGGVCQNCQHNTEGVNCDKCKPKFFRPHYKRWDEIDVCQHPPATFFAAAGQAAFRRTVVAHTAFWKKAADEDSSNHLPYALHKRRNPLLHLMKTTYHMERTILLTARETGLHSPGKATPRKKKNKETNTCPAINNTCESCDQTRQKDSTDLAAPLSSKRKAVNITSGKSATIKKIVRDPAKTIDLGATYISTITSYSTTETIYTSVTAVFTCNCDVHYSTGNCKEGTGQCECRKEYNAPLCDSCAYGYFGYPDCEPCTCNLNGTDGAHCTPQDGICPCKSNYAGLSCEICADGFYSPECKPCECNTIGSVSQVCDKDSGNCTCKSKFAGRTCDECEAGYYNYPKCHQCNCDTSGTLESICDDVTGQCICKEGFGGARCDQCISGYFMQIRGRERFCQKCECSSTGSTSTSCAADGKCNCLPNFGGKRCDQCSPGYYKYPECLPCNCDGSGSIGSTCDEVGNCHCKPNFKGTKCDSCKEKFYNYPACEECNCDPRGVIASFAGCGSVPLGELCQCKERVQGRICNDCKPLYWNLQNYNPHGCEDCSCDVAGTVGGLGACDTKSGQCTCKLHVDERQCSQCADGFYNLAAGNLFGCTECGCDIGGATDNNCDKTTGQCYCHSRVEGRACSRPIRAHYFPTLHQFRYELEEGVTPSGAVRYRDSQEAFPGHSWKGYVVFSLLQNEVINIVQIQKSSLYRLVLRYVNPLKDPVVATIVATPENINSEIQQTSQVLFRPTAQPQLITMAGEKGNAPSPFVMNPGNWTVTIKATKEIMIDYFVLIPEAYYEASVLTSKLVDRPCTIGDQDLCREFAYPSLFAYPTADASGLTTTANGYVDDAVQLKELQATSSSLPILDAQPLSYQIKIAQPGPYVIIVEYVTPVDRNVIISPIPANESTAINVRFNSGGQESHGIMNLNECLYTKPCRQVVIDERARTFVADVVGEDNVVTLEGNTEVLAGIRSIVAVPLSEWRLAYITPRPYCLRRDGRCAPAVFTASVDSKKLEFESFAEASNVRPSILDNDTSVVLLSTDSAPVTVHVKAPKPGLYMIVLHYYQPNHPESTIDVTMSCDGQKHSGHVAIEHCPSNSGCRALLKFNSEEVPIADNCTVTFEAKDSKVVWLDYLLVIQSPDFTDSVLREANTLDYSREFLAKCANNHYYVPTNVTGFCRDAVFSITAEYNSGTLGCACDVEGSTDLECEPFGGQCKCRDHVIGRTCSSCKTGYYGFPNCKPCHCPSTAHCDDDGRCICPKNVEGVNCDRCKPLTFNFDVQRGCDDCSCSPLGVVDNELQCKQDSGNCRCKENVIGRTCDHCVPGHYAFPDCVQCSCSLEGTTDVVCDQNTAQCYCKRNVRSQSCDTCKEEYFNLQASNPDGCTKCYCFGKTTRCTSAQLTWAQISGMSNWYLVNVEANRTLNVFPHTAPPSQVNESIIGVELSDFIENQKLVYFGVPEYYLGKRLTSYGGYLTYSVFYVAREAGRPISAADVIIGGPAGYIYHNSVEAAPSRTTWRHQVQLTEEQFTNLDGTAVTRDQFMSTLVAVNSIYIRATFEDQSVTTRLIDVSLDIGVDQYGRESDRVYSVEECQCPQAYKGLSCEQCASGHYRLSSGPHAGFCVPCECNGHATECDVNTGVCLDCGDNTMGDHCEFCIPGYHGNATTARDCLICACPMPYPTNNFATGCDLSENGSLISCSCKPGYGGPRCEFCAAGYYGEPEVLGDYCKPCNCSGNINPLDPSSCDSVTGDCLKCVNNTAGAACNLCAPGFYGDAVFSKNCTACSCNEYGMDHCDHATGTCVCRPGVIGDRCDQCAVNHWGLSSGRGCFPCDCGLASEEAQCDLETGQCKCAKGVTGKHCDQCAAGYWNYSKDGCDHCNCNTGYSVGFMCNATGQCECLPGVIGEKCDRCPERWVLLPQEGCLECDTCTDALIFSVQDMGDLLSNETQEFKDKADSFFTTQRLNYISNQTASLRPRLGELRSVDVESTAAAVKAVEGSGRGLLRSAEFAATDSEKQILRAAQLASDAEKLLGSLRDSAREAQAAVQHVADLATGLELSQQPKVDSALAVARQIRDDIAAKDLDVKKQQVFLVRTNATEQREKMNLFVAPVYEQAKRFEGLVNATRDLSAKMDAMLEYTDLAQDRTIEADKLNAKNRQSKFGTKVDSVSNLNIAAMTDLIEAGSDINNASHLNDAAATVAGRIGSSLDNVNIQNLKLTQALEKLAQELPDLENVTAVARNHADGLNSRAASLRALAEREHNNTRTQHAFSAASAYSNIVQEIGAAKAAAQAAVAADTNSTAVNKLLNERVGPALNRSQSLAERAQLAQREVEDALAPNQSRAEAGLEQARRTLADCDDRNNAISSSLPGLERFSLQSEMDKAERVNDTVKTTLEVMAQLGADLAASKQSAQTLPKLADEALKMKDNVENFLNNIDGTNPKLAEKYKNVAEKQAEFEKRRAEADKKLKKINDLIEQARTVANRIEVGVNFDSHATLQPRLPDTIDEMSTSTHVSAYFRTKDRDGFILYLGNPEGTMLRRTKSDDFMSISIENGHPYLLMDIGDGADSGREPYRIDSGKYVADNKWYQVIVDRVGRNVKFSIRESLDNGSDVTHTEEAVLPGQHTIFNLDRQKSKLYVGGVPSNTKLQGVIYPAFEGQIEELMVGDTPVGLWNFASAEQLKGARQRDKLITQQSGPREYRFNGRAHVTMPARAHVQPTKNHVFLFFRTYAKNGLIYLVGDDRSFFSVQMQDGRVFLQVSLGNPEELVIIGTSKTYNDGKWHQLEAGRYFKNCSLRVDNEVNKQVSNANQVEITSLDDMNFGGNNKGIIQVTARGFDGCMRQITFDGVNLDLSKNSLESIGVGDGCKFASLVSLSGSDSYLRYVNITTENLQLTLKFRTEGSADGLLFVYLSRMQTAAMQDSVSLALVKGKLVLMSPHDTLDTGVHTYNDSQWHVVTVTHGAALKMRVDDFDHYSSDTAPDPLHILDGVLLIGGAQPNYVATYKAGTRAAFRGCIADATINGRVMNLLEPVSKHGVTFGRCGDKISGFNPENRSWQEPEPEDVLPTPPSDLEPETNTKIIEPERVAPTAAPVVPVTTTTPAPTAAPRPTTPRPAPRPQPGCALAHDPHYTVGDPQEGYRFGTRNDSRIEYGKLPGRQSDGVDLTVTLRTFDRHGGLVFYGAADRDPAQFLAIYMKDARIHFAFNCGGETALIVSPDTYNDTEWHTVTVVRTSGHGKMTVDSERVGEASVTCVNPVALTAPFYYGGLRSLGDGASRHLSDFYQPFKGCLRGLMMNGELVREVLRRVNALRCTDRIEDGVYFGPSNNVTTNYLKLQESFRVGLSTSVSMEIKPRNSTGLLLSVHGKRDFLILELLEDKVVAHVENGKGPFHASYKLADKATLCDGNWHKIQMVKSRHVVSVGVDGHFSDAGIGNSASTDTRSALYIGGHEKSIARVRGVLSKRGFTGCIRNIVIRDVPVHIPLTAAGRDTHVGVCPTD